MKRAFLPTVASFTLLIALTGCNKPDATPPESYEKEIDRRVQEKLSGERLALQQKTIELKAQELQQKEQALTNREQQLAQKQLMGNPTPHSILTAPATSGELAGWEQRSDRETPSYRVFYDALAKMGDWFETSKYGFVWQPTGVSSNPRWRPYTLGHWANTEQGWTWISNEYFGWATYHYGRWTRIKNLGWVWVPGDQWAPAWVAWRYSANYVGWAPLPPESAASATINAQADDEFAIDASFYTFVPLANFGDSEINRSVFDVGQNLTIIDETVNVTNTYVDQTEVINYGPSIDLFVNRTHRPIEWLRIHRQADGESGIHNGVFDTRAPSIEHGKGNHPTPPTRRHLGDVEVDRVAPTPRLPAHHPVALTGSQPRGGTEPMPSPRQAPLPAPAPVNPRPGPAVPTPTPVQPFQPTKPGRRTPIEQPVEQPAQPVSQRPGGQSVVQPVQQPTPQRQAEATAQRAIQPVVQQPVSQAVQRPVQAVQTPVQQPVPQRQPEPAVQRVAAPVETPRASTPPPVERRVETPRPTETPRQDHPSAEKTPDKKDKKEKKE